MPEHTTPSARTIITKLYSFVQPDMRDIWTIVLFSVVVGLLALGVPIGSQMLFNYVAFGAILQPLVVLAIVLLVVLTISGIMRSVISYVVELLQRRLYVRIVTQLSERLPKVQPQAFDRTTGTDLVNRFFDIMTIQKVGATVLLDGIAAVLQTVIGLTIVAFYDPFLAVFSLLLFAAILLIVFVVGSGAARTSIAESTAKYATAATLDSIVAERRVFKQADGAGLAVRLVNERIEDWLVMRRAHFRAFFRQVVATFIVQTLAITALLTIGGYLVIIERLSLGQLVASELIVTLALTSLTKFAIKLDDIYDMYAGVYKVDGLLGLPLERQSGEEMAAEGPPVEISVRDLHFEYLPGRPIFDGLNLDIAANERVAMVFGGSAGKTTLANVLFGSRIPQHGTVMIDGIDFRELTLGTLRHRVAVAEDEEIIRGTVEENVNLGRPEADADTCRRALERVGLLEEIRSLPEGLRTELTPGGSVLSRGQRARLTIARAIAGHPGLLIVDGLLDGLDPVSRDRVIAGLTDPDWPCTVLFLSVADWYSSRGVRVVDQSTPSDGQPTEGSA